MVMRRRAMARSHLRAWSSSKRRASSAGTVIQAPRSISRLELARRPARVAHREEGLARPRAAGDVAQRGEHAGRGRHRDVARDPRSALRGVLRGVQQEALPDVDGPAVVRAHATGDAAVVEAELPEQGPERHVADGAVDDQAHRPARVVPDHVDDRAREARIPQRLGGHEELPGEARPGLRDRARGRGRGRARRRRARPREPGEHAEHGGGALQQTSGRHGTV